MQNYINNTPNKQNHTDMPTLGKTIKPFSGIKPAETTTLFRRSAFKSISDISFPTIITTDSKSSNQYNVLTNRTRSERELTIKEENESDEDDSDSDDESVNIQEIFKQDINLIFFGTLSIVGLFIFYRMIQKSK